MANDYKKGYRELTERMQNYSAQPAYEESTMAARRLFDRDREEALRDTYARMGAGRRGTGFGSQAIMRSNRDMEERFSDQVASRGLAAQQLELQGRGLEGDLLSGGWDRKIAKDNEKKKRRGGLLGAIGGVAGGLLGSAVPGVGTALGAYLGGQLGGAAGQYL
jgi:hypothetical protein